MPLAPVTPASYLLLIRHRGPAGDRRNGEFLTVAERPTCFFIPEALSSLKRWVTSDEEARGSLGLKLELKLRVV
eukprot:scaffold301643_cov14-Tisochrysis_lutea.AAC.1